MSVSKTFTTLALGLSLVGTSLLLAQGEPKPRTEPRGPLPVNYGKHGLSEDQKSKMYVVFDEYEVKIDELATQIKNLQKERNGKLNAMLTPAQKERLKEVLAEQAAKKGETQKTLEATEKAGTPAKESK